MITQTGDLVAGEVGKPITWKPNTSNAPSPILLTDKTVTAVVDRPDGQRLIWDMVVAPDGLSASYVLGADDLPLGGRYFFQFVAESADGTWRRKVSPFPVMVGAEL